MIRHNKILILISIFLQIGNLYAQPASVSVIEVTDGLSKGVALVNAGDGSNRMFAVQQTGEIKIWDGNQLLATPFLDISSLTDANGEQGLLGLAFHPNYSSNGYFYVNYTNLSDDTIVARYQVSNNSNLADSNSALQILTITQPTPNHNGGDLHFGDDGYLYIAMGDGGTGGAPAQDLNSLLGKILRIDIDGDDFAGNPAKNYVIPASNPFVGTAGADEIWLMGLRNPWRFSFDRANGDILIGDVGEGTWEEVNSLSGAIGGENFGWPCYEGDDEHIIAGCASIDNYIFPVHNMSHNNGNLSVIGGYRFRDPLYSRLNGWYFFTDWATGILWAADPNSGASWSAYNVASMGTFDITGFGEGENGEVYIVSNWFIRQIIDPDNDNIFANGFE